MRRRFERLHFVGIGGIGMAALAELHHARGFGVSGSDLVDGVAARSLRDLGIDVSIGHDEAQIGEADIVVRSSAIRDDNPELRAARERGIPVIARGALLADVMRKKDSIAIAGSHGKTTTAAMASHVLEKAGLDPTALIGGRVPRPQAPASPIRVGDSDLLVAEVDESDGSFLLTRPVMAVVTNIDPEHLDHYGDRATLLDAFARFANELPFWGAAILGIDHPGVKELAPRLDVRTVTFGFEEGADVRGLGSERTERGQACRARVRDGVTIDFEISLPGRHNILNALAAISVGIEAGLEPEVAAKALASFPGVSRRFERKGQAAGVTVVDDYAHHPAELQAALAGARSLHAGPITAIFQPHRYSRTRDCWDEFLTCFEEADRVVLCDVYAASEAPIPGIDSRSLAEAISRAGHPDVHQGGTLDEIAAIWPDRFEAGELVLTLGAGDVVTLGPRMLETLAERAEASP